jgi:hypothetical protein
MATYSKQQLSGSTGGKQIKISTTATPGTLIHAAVAGTSDWDEIWLYATNSSEANVSLTLEWGGTTAPDDLITVAVPSKHGLILIIPGLLLQNGLEVRGFAKTADVIVISGFVNRISA